MSCGVGACASGGGGIVSRSGSSFSLAASSAGIGGGESSLGEFGPVLLWSCEWDGEVVSSLGVVCLFPAESTRGVVEAIVLASSPSRGGMD